MPRSSVRPPLATRRARLAVGIVAAATGIAATTGGAAAGPAPAAAAAPGSSAACPEAWSGPFGEDQVVEGRTTVRGTVPETFAGTYVDTVPDGIGRGRDMLIFRLSGSRITDADGDVDAGVWAGISGSPVYDPGSGALIGAVSYGRSWANDVIAGVTPAADMYDVLLADGAAPRPAAGAARVAIPRAARTSLADDGVPVRRSTTLRRLDSPTYVSGVSPEVARRIGAKAGRSGTTYAAGAPAAPAAPELPIVPGGNIATTWSHGDITSAGIGSVTAVCGGEVLAYGHPDTWSGVSRQSIHGARALGIASEGGFGAFKDVAEIGAPVGSLTQDRLVGIAGTLGTLPQSADVRTSTTFAGDELDGRTVVSELATLPDVLAMQVIDDAVTAMDRYFPTGEAAMTWTISFDVGGETRRFTRSQRYSDRADLFWDMTGDIASDASAILDNRFRDVTITDVDVTTGLDDAFRKHRIGRVQVLRAGRFRTVPRGGVVTAPRGRALVVRLQLPPANRWSGVATKTRTMRFRVARGARGTGRLVLKGNAGSWDDFDFFGDFGSGLQSGLSEQAILLGGQVGPPRARPTNLTQLLDQMAAEPRGDQVSGSLAYRNVRDPDGISVRSARRGLPAVVGGTFRMRVRFR